MSTQIMPLLPVDERVCEISRNEVNEYNPVIWSKVRTDGAVNTVKFRGMGDRGIPIWVVDFPAVVNFPGAKGPINKPAERQAQCLFVRRDKPIGPVAQQVTHQIGFRLGLTDDEAAEFALAAGRFLATL